ncbi:MAG: HEPN domain-containing protein [Candidatus Heimdallarchaeota archaeon]
MCRHKDWLQYSEELLEIGALLIEKQKYSWACFTMQQASSAALKSILSKNDESTFGDNLIKLLRTIGNTHTVSTEIKNACHQINDYFTKARDLETVTKGTPLTNHSIKDANQAKANALAIIRFAYQESH